MSGICKADILAKMPFPLFKVFTGMLHYNSDGSFRKIFDQYDKVRFFGQIEW